MCYDTWDSCCCTSYLSPAEVSKALSGLIWCGQQWSWYYRLGETLINMLLKVKKTNKKNLLFLEEVPQNHLTTRIQRRHMQPSCPQVLWHTFINICVHVSSNSKHEYGSITWDYYVYKEQMSLELRSQMYGNGCVGASVHQASFHCVKFALFQLHIKPCKQVQYKKPFINLLKFFIRHVEFAGASLPRFIAFRCVTAPVRELESWTGFGRTNSVGICPKLSIDTSSFLQNKAKLSSPAGTRPSIRRANVYKTVSHLCISMHVSLLI